MNKVMPIVVSVFVFLAGPVLGQVPAELYYDSFYPEDGDINLVIRIYTNATSGDYLYEDSATVTVAGGAFSTRIGDNSTSGTLTNALATGRAYLDVTINGVNMPPREQILPEAYALKAGAVSDGAVTASMLADGAVQGRHVAAGAISAGHLAAAAVTADKLAPDVQAANDSRYVNAAGDAMTGDVSVSNLTVLKNATVGGGFTNPVKFISKSGVPYAVLDPAGQGSLFMGPQMPAKTGSLYSLNLGFRDSGTLNQSLTYKGGLNWGVVGPDLGTLIQSNRGYLGINIGYAGGYGGSAISGQQIVDMNANNNNNSLAINLGNFTRGTMATQYNMGGLNYGSFVAFGGTGGLQYNDGDAVNVGAICDGGYQKARGAGGSFNLGYLRSYEFKGAGTAEQGLYNSYGAFNMGYLDAASSTKAKQIISNVNAGINFGYVRGGLQIVKANGAGNFGCLDVGEYQVTAGKGSFSWGSRNSNVYNYAYALGFGVDTFETNSLSARRFWEGGTPLDQKYAAAGAMAAKLDIAGGTMTGPLTLQRDFAVLGTATVLRVVKQGDISMGTFTNGP